MTNYFTPLARLEDLIDWYNEQIKEEEMDAEKIIVFEYCRGLLLAQQRMLQSLAVKERGY